VRGSQGFARKPRRASSPQALLLSQVRDGGSDWKSRRQAAKSACAD